MARIELDGDIVGQDVLHMLRNNQRELVDLLNSIGMVQLADGTYSANTDPSTMHAVVTALKNAAHDYDTAIGALGAAGDSQFMKWEPLQMTKP